MADPDLPVEAPDGATPASTEKPAFADIIERTADLLERDGWTVGTYMCAHGKRCAEGALIEACKEFGLVTEGPYAEWLAFSNRAARALRVDGGCYLPGWNDDQLRDEDVIAAFRDLAFRERSERPKEREGS